MKNSLSSIAKNLKREVSTITREIKRNKGEKGYRPQQAHAFALERAKHQANGPRVSQDVWSAAKL